MQWIGVLILVGILAVVLIAAIYFGSHQKTRRSPYSSWGSILGPRTYSPMMDIHDNLERDASSSRRSRRALSRHKREK